MITEQFVLTSEEADIEEFNFVPDLILIFISYSFQNIKNLKRYRIMYPDCVIVGSSANGEIEDISVHENSVVITGVKFDSSKVIYNEVYLPSVGESYSAGSELISKFDKEGLKHIYVLSEGSDINGDDFVKGITHQSSSSDFSITGGLAWHGKKKYKSFVLTNEFYYMSNIVVGIGFYGDDLKVGFGALHGLNSLGVDRIVTKSEGTIVYEIDDEPAYELLKRLLGGVSNFAETALMLPLSFREKVTDKPIARSITRINEIDGSITFMGNIPEGSYVRLVKSNIDRVINAAEGAAEVSIEPIGNTHTDLSIITSCASRRKMLKELVEEEVQAVREVIGEDAIITGFYSNGEISPYISDTICQFQNNSILVTSFSESSIE
jgi:hypothetical protein